jgi:D-arabinose 1-dehydrogenase-like Zn-dependent alcohol dehydrogenase
MGGQVVSIGFLSKSKKVPNILPQHLLKGIYVRGILVGSKQLSEELVRFVHAKKLRLPVEKVYGFTQEGVLAAYAKIQSQTIVGKIVIKVD